MVIKKILLCMILLSILPLCTGFSDSGFSDVSIEIQASDVGPGDMISFTYTLASEEKLPLRFIPSIRCPSAPTPLIESEDVLLEPDVPYHGSFSTVEVSDDLEPQECVASIYVILPYEKHASESFVIMTKDKALGISAGTSPDAIGFQKVYYKGDVMLINSQGSALRGSVTFPDKSVQALRDSLVLDQTGTYSIEYESLETQDTRALKEKLVFSVIEKPVEPRRVLQDEAIEPDLAGKPTFVVGALDEDLVRLGYVLVGVLLVAAVVCLLLQKRSR